MTLEFVSARYNANINSSLEQVENKWPLIQQLFLLASQFPKPQTRTNCPLSINFQQVCYLPAAIPGRGSAFLHPFIPIKVKYF